MYEQHFRINVSEIETFNNELKGEITLVLSEKYKIESNMKLSEKDKKLLEN